MSFAGETAFLRIFDLGGTLDMDKARAALGGMAEPHTVSTRRAVPEYVSFAEPLPLNLSTLNIDLGRYQDRAVSVTARLYEVGALALTLRVPVEGPQINAFAKASSHAVALNGATECHVRGILDHLEARLRAVLKSAIDEVFQVRMEPERYTVYFMTTAPVPASELLETNRSHLAGLLRSEPEPELLAPGEIEDAMEQCISYYTRDFAIVDWDATVLYEPSGQYEDVMYVLEIANLQLLVLRKYDKYLDGVLQRSYAEFEKFSRRPRFFASQAARMSRDLAEVRMDMARVTDELRNISKFFGEWYLARVYIGAAKQLHVAEFQKSVDRKVTTMKDLYENALHEVDSRRAGVMELTIVLLIVLEIFLAMIGHM